MTQSLMMIVSLQENYLKERIKVNGKTNNLTNAVSLERTKTKVTINSDIHFSKRYVQTSVTSNEVYLPMPPILFIPQVMLNKLKL
jgi:hypothetical protein